MRTQKQIEANYTELIHAGEGIEIEKGNISATGSGGSGGGDSGSGAMYLVITEDGDDYTYNYTSSEIRDALTNHIPIYLSKMEDGGYTDIIPMTAFSVDDDIWGVAFTGITTYNFGNGEPGANLVFQRVEVYDEGEGIVAEITTSGLITIGDTID